MKVDRVCFLDVETTGLDPSRHELLQIGFVIVPVSSLLDPRDTDLTESASLYVMPERLETADPDALKVSGYTEESHRAKGVMSLDAALDVVFDYLDDGVMLAGHNVEFDWSFIRAAFRAKGRELPRVDYHRLDTASLGFPLYLMGHIEKLGLQELALHLGVPGRKLETHDALEDARMALGVVRAVMKLLSPYSLRVPTSG